MKRAPMNYGISRSHIYVSLESYICITEVPKGEERDRKTEKNILRRGKRASSVWMRNQ